MGPPFCVGFGLWLLVSAADAGAFGRMAVRRCGLKSTRFEIDLLQVVIYLEDAGLNVSACLALVEKSKKGERAGLPLELSV